MAGLTVIRRCAGPPQWICLVCLTPFFEGEERAFERHVAGSPSTPGCAEREEARLRDLSLRERMPAIFDPLQSGDVDLELWIQKHRQALLEDRKKL